jgi:hypothetical protein
MGANTTIAKLEAELDGYRAKGGAFFEDAASFEAKKRADAEAKVAALEAEVARLKELAELGEAVVEGMGTYDVLRRVREDTWHVYTNAEGNMVCDAVSEGPTALAALRAAEGEGDDAM